MVSKKAGYKTIPRDEKIKYLQQLEKKHKSGEPLTPQEAWDLDNIHTLFVEELEEV